MLIDEAVERDQLADNWEEEFEYSRPELTKPNNREHLSHLHSCDDDFDCEGHREGDYSVEHLFLLNIEWVGLVQSYLV